MCNGDLVVVASMYCKGHIEILCIALPVPVEGVKP